MTKRTKALADAVGGWLESTGYTGEFSAVIAGIIDCQEGYDKLYNTYYPILTRLDPQKDYDEIQTVIIDALAELEHLGHHMFDAAEQLDHVHQHLNDRFERVG